MWRSYWNLDRDPFDDRAGPFVELPAHVEARARLVHAIQTFGRSASLMAAAGLGKSTVLGQALDATRSPTRRVARALDPIDGPSLFATLAQSLGVKVGPDPSRALAWRALTEACRLARWQGQHVVIVIDGIETLESPADRLDLDRILHLEPGGRVTMVQVGRPTDPPRVSPSDCLLPARLHPLTRSEAARYLAEKLHHAGRAGPTFTTRALTRLHSLCEGVPRAINQIARLTLIAASVQGTELITDDMVDATSRECLNFVKSAV